MPHKRQHPVTETTPLSRLPGALLPSEAATLLRVSPRTINRMVERGDLEKVPGIRVTRVRRSSVLKAMLGDER